MGWRPAKDAFVAVFLLAMFLVCAGTGAYVVYRIQQCSRPGFVPYGCPIVIHLGK